jgi:hypothetical protein
MLKRCERWSRARLQKKSSTQTKIRLGSSIEVGIMIKNILINLLKKRFSVVFPNELSLNWAS